MIFGVLLSSLSQVLLKKSADKHKGTKSFWKQYLDLYVIGGYTLLLTSMVIPLYTFRYVDLKYGAVVESISYVFIMLLSALFIHEKITKRKLIGNIFIIVGIIIFVSNIFK